MTEILVFQRQKETPPGNGNTHAIRIVTDRREAEEVLQNQNFRLILIDLEGAEEKGLEFAFFVRELKGYYLTPILFFARDRKYEQMAFHDIHCYDYMVKPIQEEEIIRILYLYLTYNPVSEEKSQMRFQIHGEDYMIPIQDIVYLETWNRSVFVHAVNQVLEAPYLKLCDCVSRGGGKFVQCHRSYAVNRSFIRKIDYGKHQIELKEDYGRVDMGRKYERMLRHEFDA